jgi:hypothetical protein
MTTGKCKKAVHFGSTATALEEAEVSDKSRCSEDAKLCPSLNDSQASVRPPSPGSFLRYVLISRLGPWSKLTGSEWQENRPSQSQGGIQASRGRKLPSSRHHSSPSAQSRPTDTTANGATTTFANRTPPTQSTVIGSIRSGFSYLVWGGVSGQSR